MTIAHQFFTPAEAQRLTQRIKLTAGTIRDNLWKLRNLVDEAKTSNAWQILGFPSWTAYLADTLADEPMRLGREERQELVGYLSGEGLSTRAIAPIVGVDQKTVVNDLRREENSSPVGNPTPAPPEHRDLGAEREALVDEMTSAAEAALDKIKFVINSDTGEVTDIPSVTEHTVTEKVKTVTGLDGKTYTTPAPSAPRRKALTDAAKDIGWELRKATDKLQRITEDDRFSRNKEEVAALIKGHLMFTVEVCQDLLDKFNN